MVFLVIAIVLSLVSVVLSILIDYVSEDDSKVSDENTATQGTISLTVKPQGTVEREHFPG